MEPPSSSQPAAPPSTDAPPPQQPRQQPPPQSQSQSQSQPPSSSSLPPSSSSSSSTSSIPIPTPNPNPNPNPSPNPNPNPNPTNTLPTLPQSSQQFSRPWSQPQPPSQQFSHFPTQYAPALPSSAPSTAQRGTIAIGVPAASPSPTPPQPAAAAGSNQPASYSTGFVGAQYAGIPRVGPDPNVTSAAPSSASVRPSMHGMPNLGMMSSQIRPGAVAPSAVHQQRPVQAASGIRPQNAPNNMPPVPQNFQGHGILRGSSVGGPSSATPSSSSQSQASGHQPWLSTAPHGRPPIPSQPFRQQANSQTVQQQRPPHVPLQSPQAQAMHTASQPQQSSSSSQPSNQSPQDNNNNNNPGQQLPPSRVPPQPSVNQPGTRIQGMATQRPPSPAAVAQPSVAQPSSADQPGGGDILETCNRILSKRNIQELVNQIDPSEKLDPEVEDVLVDIAEDFIESVTTFGCSLAKHRKSNTLEAKDILLHIERAWNMTLPGFSGDEIKTFKKPVINDVHRERLAVVKKSIAAGETVNSKSSGGPGGANAKGSLVKANPNAAG